jgi:2'-5' RNA ligase
MAYKRRGQLIRGFIALKLGKVLLPTASSAIRTLMASPQGDAIRWVRPENLHVTLRFLGGIREDLLEPLHRAVGLAVATQPAFNMRIGPLGLFPRSRRPRVVAAALLPENPVSGLAAAVDRGIQAAGLPGEERTFRAHLTLGRVKRNAPRSLAGLTEKVDQMNQEPESPTGSDRITQVVMLRSDLKPDGPVYTELWTAPLAGS